MHKLFEQQSAAILIFPQATYKPYTIQYITKGASGFLDKSSSEKELLLAIEMITLGQLYLPKDMLLTIYNQSASTEQNAKPFKNLSRRDLEVFKLLIKGKRVKDISKIMQIHQSVTSTLKKRIMYKFKVDNHMKQKSMAIENWVLRIGNLRWMILNLLT